MPAQMDLYANLALTFNGDNLKVLAEGDTITVVFPTFRAGMRFFRRLMQDPQGAATLRKIDMYLCNLYKTLIVRAGKITVALLGMKANPDILTVMLGLNGMRRRLGGF